MSVSHMVDAQPKAPGKGWGEPLHSDHMLLQAFASQQDESAFRGLVERHGPMVLRVCRHVTGDEHAAEDAFQATFVVLARKAATIVLEGSLAGWLSSVAYRTAQHVRASMARQRAKESEVPVKPDVPAHDPGQTEIFALLHSEIATLPEELRVVIVLCYLEGQTHEEAAAELDWPLGTVKTRLNRGRERLRQRLARRGIALGLLWLLLDSSRATAAPMSTNLVEKTVRMALLSAAEPVSSLPDPSPAPATFYRRLPLPMVLTLLWPLLGVGLILIGFGSTLTLFEPDAARPRVLAPLGHLPADAAVAANAEDCH